MQYKWLLQEIKQDAGLAPYQKDSPKKRITSIEQVVCMRIAAKRSPTAAAPVRIIIHRYVCGPLPQSSAGKYLI